MTEELPKELLEALETTEQAQMKHNWMYSFMPVSDEIFLVGYCKACDQGVSSLLPVSDYKTIVREMDIPKWGCVPKQEL